jgi:hypothetical protein
MGQAKNRATEIAKLKATGEREKQEYLAEAEPYMCACDCSNPNCPDKGNYFEAFLWGGTILPELPDHQFDGNDTGRDLCIYAVPVGGRRKGGTYCTTKPDAVLALLKGKQGFPNLRVEEVTPHGTMIAWGEPIPEGDHVTLGQFFGYSERMIARWESEPKDCDCLFCRRAKTFAATAAGK